MNTTDTSPAGSAQAAGAASPRPAGSWKKKLLIFCGVFALGCGLAAAATAWWVKRNFDASPLKPVMLSQAEQAALDEKVRIISAEPAPPAADGRSEEQRAAEAKRTLSITEHEINGYLAKQGLGEQFKVSLGDGDAAVTLVAPVDKSVPFIGGTTLRVKVALNASIESGRKCALSIADVTVGGVPLPNAWLGGIKGVNMLAANMQSDPVAKRFLDGIRELDISTGAIRVVLNE